MLLVGCCLLSCVVCVCCLVFDAWRCFVLCAVVLCSVLVVGCLLCGVCLLLVRRRLLFLVCCMSIDV